MQPAGVVEADIVLEHRFPLLKWTREDSVPEFFLNCALDAFHLSIEAGSPGSYACMPDAQSLQEVTQLAAELRTIVGLDAA
jgi:hypothetical protein